MRLRKGERVVAVSGPYEGLAGEVVAIEPPPPDLPGLSDWVSVRFDGNGGSTPVSGCVLGKTRKPAAEVGR